MKKLLITLFALMITVLAFVACSEGGNVQDESSDGAGSLISSVADEITSDVSGAESDTTASSEAASGTSSQDSSN